MGQARQNCHDDSTWRGLRLRRRKLFFTSYLHSHNSSSFWHADCNMQIAIEKEARMFGPLAELTNRLDWLREEMQPSFYPPLNAWEEGEAIKVEAEIPGVKLEEAEGYYDKSASTRACAHTSD